MWRLKAPESKVEWNRPDLTAARWDLTRVSDFPVPVISDLSIPRKKNEINVAIYILKFTSAPDKSHTLNFSCIMSETNPTARRVLLW